MTLEEIEQHVRDVDQRLQNIKIYLDDAKKQQPEQPKLERWIPKDSQFYYFIVSDLSVEDDQYYSSSVSDNDRWENFNCYPSAKEAQQEALRTKARRKLEWYARELNKGKNMGRCVFVFRTPRAAEALKTKKGVIIDNWACFGDVPDTLVYFVDMEAAEYALSQMTAEELKALR